MVKKQREEISDMLTEEGRQKLLVGQVLMFNDNGVETQWKVVRKTKAGVWVEKIRLLTAAEFDNMNNTTNKPL